MHRDPLVWQQSQEFRPQRWLPYLEGAKAGSYMGLLSNLGPNKSFLPFGAGPRSAQDLIRVPPTETDQLPRVIQADALLLYMLF